MIFQGALKGLRDFAQQLSGQTVFTRANREEGGDYINKRLDFKVVWAPHCGVCLTGICECLHMCCGDVSCP